MKLRDMGLIQQQTLQYDEGWQLSNETKMNIHRNLIRNRITISSINTVLTSHNPINNRWGLHPDPQWHRPPACFPINGGLQTPSRTKDTLMQPIQLPARALCVNVWEI